MGTAKLVNFITSRAAKHYSGIVGTLCRPTVIFLPADVPPSQLTENVLAAANGSTSYAVMSERPASETLKFFVINIVIGTIMGKLVPDGQESPDLLGTLCFSFVSAFLAILFVHLFCKLLKGQGSFWMTFSVYLHVQSTMFLVASFCALLWGLIMWPPQVIEFVERHSSVVASLGENSTLVFPIVLLLLEAVYMPLALAAVHSFGHWKGAIVWWTVVVLFLVINVLGIILLHGC